ncbi:MAG: hemolysin III [Halocynthiibacter sp.]|jgi:hemolysin III
MTISTYPSQTTSHRLVDLVVHIAGLIMILLAGWALIFKAADRFETGLILAVVVYVLCALASNLASWAYHFSPWHARRTFLRRIDHAAIYLSITGTFTPFFVQASTTWTLTLLWLCWALTALAIWKKITDENVKSKWSTASYLILGAIGLSAFPDLTEVPTATLWCIAAGAASYVIGTAFYVRKSMPFRYATWHICVTFGAVFMYIGIWLALFQS